jgi:hypothetical protein
MSNLSDWIDYLSSKYDNPSIKRKIRDYVIAKGISNGTYYNILNHKTGVKPIYLDAFLEAFKQFEPELTIEDIKNPIPENV